MYFEDKEINEVLLQTKKNNSLTILWFSDIHGDSTRLSRIMEFYHHFNEFFNDILHSGDNVRRHYPQGMSFWDSVSGTNAILNVIGNHDTAVFDNERYDWHAKNGLDCYNQFVAPYVSSWNDVVFPEDAQKVGRCYYYKDYAAQGVRLVVLDCMVMNPSQADYDPSQLTWLESVLTNAKDNDLSVLLCSHCPPKSVPIDCSFTSNQFDANGLFGGGFGGDAPFISVVDNYIESGGLFISWICGDTHRDYLGYVKSSKHIQPVLVSTCALCNSEASLTMRRVPNSASEDVFNILSIDTKRHNIKLKRVGASVDVDFKSHNLLSYDYEKNVVLESK